MKRKYFYTNDEENFIKKNYPIHGSAFILNKLNITKKSLEYLNTILIVPHN